MCSLCSPNNVEAVISFTIWLQFHMNNTSTISGSMSSTYEADIEHSLHGPRKALTSWICRMARSWSDHIKQLLSVSQACNIRFLVIKFCLERVEYTNNKGGKHMHKLLFMIQYYSVLHYQYATLMDCLDYVSFMACERLIWGCQKLWKCTTWAIVDGSSCTFSSFGIRYFSKVVHNGPSCAALEEFKKQSVSRARHCIA